ncbi:hypothetical protein [Stella sp.]|uniref:hypothetical protein n=1 Tax=Stella sp. TaxID=2912054 RepID=UPI0035AF069B
MATVVVTAWDLPRGVLLSGLLASLDAVGCDLPVRVLVPDHAAARAVVARRRAAGIGAVVLRPRGDEPFADALARTRPLLPQAAPGFGRHLWLDPATWVQAPDALPVLAAAAGGGRLAGCYQADRAYPAWFGDDPPWAAMRRAIEAAFGSEAGSRLWMCPVIDGGVLALDADAPHWQAWAAAMAEGWERRAAVPAPYAFADLALTVAVVRGRLPFAPLPAAWNWLCHQALPRWTGEQLVEPVPPGAPIRILHLSGPTRAAVMRLGDGAGGHYRSTLRHPLAVAREEAAP